MAHDTVSPASSATSSSTLTTSSQQSSGSTATVPSTAKATPQGQSFLEALVSVMRHSPRGAFDVKYDSPPGAELGHGGMSEGVHIARTRSTQAEFAVKVVPTKGMTTKQFKQVLAEATNQRKFSHPNICRLYEVYAERTQLRFVLERINGPDLYEHWLSRSSSFEEHEVVTIMRQLCEAIAYCHRKGVCHRDLKLQNVCTEKDRDGLRVKLIDFGLSQEISSAPMADVVGSAYYCAPEVLGGCYTEKCDMWSLGVIAYILLSDRAPFRGKTDEETFALIREGAYDLEAEPWDQRSSAARDFISRLLSVDPDVRLGAEEALEHPWLATKKSLSNARWNRAFAAAKRQARAARAGA